MSGRHNVHFRRASAWGYDIIRGIDDDHAERIIIGFLQPSVPLRCVDVDHQVDGDYGGYVWTERMDLFWQDTALHIALKLGKTAAVKAILSLNPNWSIPNGAGETAEALCLRLRGTPLAEIKRLQVLEYECAAMQREETATRLLLQREAEERARLSAAQQKEMLELRTCGYEAEADLLYQAGRILGGIDALPDHPSRCRKSAGSNRGDHVTAAGGNQTAAASPATGLSKWLRDRSNGSGRDRTASPSPEPPPAGTPHSRGGHHWSPLPKRAGSPSEGRGGRGGAVGVVGGRRRRIGRTVAGVMAMLEQQDREQHQKEHKQSLPHLAQNKYGEGGRNASEPGSHHRASVTPALSPNFGGSSGIGHGRQPVGKSEDMQRRQVGVTTPLPSPPRQRTAAGATAAAAVSDAVLAAALVRMARDRPPYLTRLSALYELKYAGPIVLEDAALLAEVLAHDPHVTHLNLSGKRLGDGGVAALATALAPGRRPGACLRYVDLSRNNVTDAGAEALAAALLGNSSGGGSCPDRSGDSSGGGAEGGGGEHRPQRGIDTLILSGNRLSLRGISVLAEVCSRSPTLDYLDLRGNLNAVNGLDGRADMPALIIPMPPPGKTVLI